MAQSSIRSKIKKSFRAIGEYPIKTHGMPKHRRLTYVNQKLDKTAKLVQHHVATAIGLSENEISLPVGNVSAEIEQKFRPLNGRSKNPNGSVYISKEDTAFVTDF